MVAVGDLAVLLVFAWLGRASHHSASKNPILAVAVTAIPFIAGWAVASLICGTYSRGSLRGRGWMETFVGAWLLAAALALVVRSILEHHLMPPSFIVVAVVFNFVLLLAWRLTARWIIGRSGGRELNGVPEPQG